MKTKGKRKADDRRNHRRFEKNMWGNGGGFVFGGREKMMGRSAKNWNR